MNPYREHHEEEKHKSTYMDKIKCFFSRHVFHFKERVEIQIRPCSICKKEQHYYLFIYECIHCGKHKTKPVNAEVCLWNWIENYEQDG